MSEFNAKSVIRDSNGLIERINALLPTIVPGQVINYLEFDVIESSISYRKFVRNSRSGAHGHISDAGEYGQFEAEKFYRQLCAKRDEAESVFPAMMELNDKADKLMIEVWNRAHDIIYDAKVYGTLGYPHGWVVVSTIYKDVMRKAAQDIWGSDVEAEQTAKENYLALRKQYRRLVASVNSQLAGSLI